LLKDGAATIHVQAKESKMQMVSEIMTRDVRFVSPQENVQRAAQMMDELNVGALPVCDGERLVGMVTDRDITVRSTAAGKAPQDAHVEEVMSADVRWCFEDQPLDEVMIQMADSQIRRIPVVTHDDRHKLIGVVSLGDVATKTPAGQQKETVEQVVEMVSSPSAPGNLPRGADDVGGRTGGSDSDRPGGGTDKADMAGVEMPSAGQSGIGAAGASGTGKGSAGSTGDPRGNFGVSGQDLTKDGLPPA
jgi:CBS domain-containing protein